MISKLIEDFSYLDSWEDRYQYLIDLGRNLPPFKEEDKTDINKVYGCSASVWITATLQNGLFYFAADSDAHIVKGLEAVLLLLVNGKTAAEIKALDIEGIFNQLQLSEHLSPTRRNGFFSMVQKIKQLIQ